MAWVDCEPSSTYNVQVNSDPPGAKVGDTQNATYYILSELVKHQYFPDRLAVGIKHGCRFGVDAISGAGIVTVMLRSLVQVENFLDGCYTDQ